MGVSDIIDFIITFEKNKEFSTVKLTRFNYENIDEVYDFEINLIEALNENFSHDENFKIVSSSEKHVNAIIYNKMHRIYLEGKIEDDTVLWRLWNDERMVGWVTK